MAEEILTVHDHPVIDDDPHFVIDGNSRTISNASENLPVLIQYDHNSEQFTFEVPKVIDGHDMTLCNHVEVHYINVDKTNIANTSSSRYDVPVEDIKQKTDDPNTLVFSWLIDGKATKYIGPLNFAVRFRCTVDTEEAGADGETVVKTVDTYRLNTKPFIGVNVEEGMDTQLAMSDEYADVIDQWQNAIDAYGDSSVTKIETEYKTAIANISETVTNAKTSAKDEIAQIVSDSRKELAASTLDAKEILVQSTGYHEDRVMSQKAVTDQINRLDNVVVGLGTNVEQKIGEKYKHMEETFTSLSELISYQQVDDRNGFSTSEFGRTYVFKPLYGHDNVGNAVENPIQIVYETECAFRVAGALADKTLVYYHDNIELHKVHVFDEYRTYQSIRLLGRKTYVEFDPNCYILVTADPNNGEWMDSTGRDAAPGDNRVPYFSELRSGSSGAYSYVERNTYTSTVKPETFSRVNSVPNSKCIHAYIGDNGLVEVECTLYQRTGTNGETIYFFFEDDCPRYRIRTTFAYEFNGVRYEQTRSDYIYKEDYSGDAYDYIWGTPEVRGVSSTLCVDRVSPAYVRTFEYDEPHDNVPEFTVAANGISSVTGPIKNGLKDTYTIVFDNGTSRTFEVTNGRAIETIEYASTTNSEDTYEIRFNDGTKQTFTVPNVEANRAYLEGNVDDVHTTLNKAGVTSIEQVSEVTSLVDVPEKTTKFARLNSFGGMSNKIAIPSAQGVNLIPFPYAGNNFGTDGAGTVELNSTYGYSVAIIDETNPWTVPDTGMYEQAYRFTNCSAFGQGTMRLVYTHDGVEMSNSDIPTPNLTYDVVLKPGDVVTNWSFYGENADGSCELTVQPGIYMAAFDSETDEWVYYDYEWEPSVAQYRFANTKLQAIKSVGANLIPCPTDMYNTERSYKNSGVTYTFGSDSGISMSGSLSSSFSFCTFYSSSENLRYGAGTYTLSAEGLDDNVSIEARVRKGETNALIGYAKKNAPLKFKVLDGEYITGLSIIVTANTTCCVYPMLNTGDTALPWEPYVEHICTIPSDIPAPGGFVDVACNKHADAIDVSTQTCNRNVSVLRCTGAENWREYAGGTNTRPSGVYVYALNLADKKPGLTNMACAIGKYKPDAYDYGDDGDFCGHRSLNTVYFATSKYTTLSAWKAELSRLSACCTPLTIYYELADPIVTDLPTRLDRLIPVEPNGHLIAVTETRDSVTNAVIATGYAVPLDVEITVINDAGFSEALDRIIAIQNALIGGGA